MSQVEYEIYENGQVYMNTNSIFSTQESIWTYNCPCPTGSLCLKKNKQHVCRFKHFTAGKTHEDLEMAKKLADQFQELLILFNTPRKPMESNVPYTTYAELRELRDKIGVKMRTKLCRHSSTCFNDHCVFAHSVYEMIRVFDEPRIRHFYKNVANIRSQVYKPQNYATQDQSLIGCQETCECSVNRCLVQLRLYDSTNEELIYPYFLINCNACKRVANVAVYK